MSEFEYPISLHVHVDNQADVVRVVETLFRTVAGLGMDGLHASLHVDRYERDHEDEEVG